MRLSSTLTDAEEISGVTVVMKNISHTFTAQFSGQGEPSICMMLMHSNHLLFGKSNSNQNETPRKIAHNKLKTESAGKQGLRPRLSLLCTAFQPSPLLKLLLIS